jgi:hypothetical protein
MEDFIYKMKTAWSPIKDIRSDITYRVFTEAHDIVDKRPRYETLKSEVPVIKMEQITNWEFVPVVEQQLDWSGSAVTPDGPLDLSVFSLDTLSAKGNITITAKGNVLVKAGMEASGEESGISVESAEGDVTIGGDMPVNPRIYDMIRLTATRSIELTAAGDVLIGETATLETTSEDTPVPGEMDVVVVAGESVTVAGEILARTGVEISAGTDGTVTGLITAAHSRIEISAGEGGAGNIILHRAGSGDGAEELDENNERPSLGGTLRTLGEGGEIDLRAGASAGDISLFDAHITSSRVMLEAAAGIITQSGGVSAEDDETVPSAGGLIAGVSLEAQAGFGILLENVIFETIEAVVTGAGGIEIHNTGFMPPAQGEEIAWPDTVILANIETADGPIFIETISDNLVITSVRSLTDSDDNDIVINARAAGTGGVAVEIHDLVATGEGDVTLAVEGTISQPDGSLAADGFTMSAFGSVELKTNLSSLALEISGNGDLVVENTSGDLILENIVVTNGNIDVLAHGNLVARNVVLATDWNTTRIPPGANIITLRTAEGSGGAITVVNVSAGTYATSEEEAAAIRLEMLNTLLAGIDVTGIPADLLVDSTDSEGTPIQIVRLTMEQAQDLAAIVSVALAAATDPAVLVEADFADGTLMTGNVAFLIFTRLLDHLDVAYEAVFGNDGNGETPAPVVSETLSLLTLTKQFSSQGKVSVQADGAIVNGAGAGVSIVADSVTLLAKSSVSGLTMAVNTIENAQSLLRGTVSLFDVDGIGELTPGLEMVTADAGPLSVTAQAGFIVGNAFSRGPGASLTLTSTNHSIFVKETGNSLISEGDITLNAAGDVILTGHVQANSKATFDAGRYLSTFGQEALLEVGSLVIKAGSTVTLSGHLSGLRELDVVSAGNVNLLGNVENHKGLNVYVESVALQQQLLSELNANLKKQTQYVQTYQALELSLASRLIGQGDVLGSLKNTYLQDLVKLPLDVQARQVADQLEGMRTLIDVQSILPDRIEQVDGYLDLVAERATLLDNLKGFEADLGVKQTRINEIAGNVAGLNEQLGLLQGTISSRQEFGSQLDGLLSSVQAELSRRDLQMPSASSEAPVLSDLESLSNLNLSGLSNARLTGLAGDLLAVRGSVNTELSGLAAQETQLIGLIDLNKGSLITVTDNLQMVQATIVATGAQITALDAQLSQLNGAIGIISSLEGESDYAVIDAALRDLGTYSAILSPTMQDLVGELIILPPYIITLGALENLTTELALTEEALGMVTSLGDVQDAAVLDSGLRDLQSYQTLLSPEFASKLNAFTTTAPVPLMMIRNDLNTAQTNLSSTTTQLNRVNTQLTDLSRVSGLLDDTKDAFSERFQIDQRTVQKVSATYLYDPKLGGSAIKYGDQVWKLTDLNRTRFFQQELTQEQLIVLYSGLYYAGEAIPGLESNKTQLQSSQQTYQTQVNSLTQQKTTVEGLVITTAGDLSGEQSYLESQKASLSSEVGTYQVLFDSIDEILGLAVQTIPSEQVRLEGERDALVTQRSGLAMTYEQALGTESVLVAQKNALSTELAGLNEAAGVLQLNIGTAQSRLGVLAGQESVMKADLAGIVQQKWTERLDLGGSQLMVQAYEAELLRTAQNLRTQQGSLILGGLTQAYRDNLEIVTGRIAFLRSEVSGLKVQEGLLVEQLQQAQAGQQGPLTVRIEALGLQFASDVIAYDTAEFTFNQLDLIGPFMPKDGEVVAQDDSTGYYLYQNQETGDLYYRDVAGTPEDPSDDTFYVRQVALEPLPDGGIYRDIQGTPDDLSDDDLYFISAPIEGPVYPFDGAYVVKRLIGVTTETRTEIRSDTGKPRQVTITSDLFSVEDYRYGFFALDGEPSFGVDPIFILDPATHLAVDFNSILAGLTAELPAGGRLIVLYPGQTLTGEITRNDIVVIFLDFAPVFTPLSSEGFTFVNPEDYSGVEVEEVPALFAEVLYNGEILLPVVERQDGNINFSNMPLTASGSLTLIASSKISGLMAGEVLSAGSVFIESRDDLYISGKILGKDLVDVHTDGNLYLGNTAYIQAETVNFVSASGSVLADQGSLVYGDVFMGQAGKGFDVFGDFNGYFVEVVEGGDVHITDKNTLGRDKAVTLGGVETAYGMVSVTADTTVKAGFVGANDIMIVTRGAGNIEIGRLHTWGSTITLDAARYVLEMAGVDSEIVATELNIIAGLNINVNPEFWGIANRTIRPNLSVLIDETYQGPLTITAERDIIVDTAVVTSGDVNFTAQNIIFTDKGSISNAAGTTVFKPANALIFQGLNNTILSRSVDIEASLIQGGDQALIRADTLFAVANSGFGLKTEVRELKAKVLGAGHLNIQALSSVELSDVEVLDGSVSVTSTGNILAKNVKISTDRYSNQLSLSAAGDLSIDRVVVGQTMALTLEAGAEIKNVEKELVVVPSVVDDVIYEGDAAEFRVDVSDPSGLFLPGAVTLEIFVDFGDGTPLQTLYAPAFQMDPDGYGDPALVLEGDEPGSWLGRSIASVGDVNGDGFADLVVADSLNDRIFLYLGGKDGLKFEPIVIEGTAGSGFGSRVAGAGDVNGDGLDDVVVVAPDQMTERTVNVVNDDGSVSQETIILKGQVLLYAGSPEGLSSTPFWTFENFKEGDALRLVVSSAGDVNNDGFDDILIGVPYADVDRVEADGLVRAADAGLAYLFLGSGSGLSQEPSWIYRGRDQDGLFGWAVSTAGDVNGDSFDDVMISGLGRSYLFVGGETGLSILPKAVFDGAEDGDGFGTSMAAAGDVNKDGFGDVVIGAPGLNAGSGGVYLYLGSLDGLVETPLFIGAPAGHSGFGWEVSGAGDVNADGFRDVLVRSLAVNDGAKEGRVFLYFGAAEGLANGAVEFNEGKEVGTGFGDGAGSIAGLGDVNGDGYDDVAVGAWLRGEEQGAVFIYQGAQRAVQALTIASVHFDHVYVEDGTYVVWISVTGAADGGDLGALTVTVQNADPVVTTVTVNPAEIDENGTVTVTGSFTDAGILDTHTAAIDWGDGVVTLAALDQAAGSGTFTASHQYLDNHPSGLPYTITATVTDDDGGVGTGTTTVTVNNVAPVITALELDQIVIDENGFVTVTGAFSDVGTQDTHTVMIDWGDGFITPATVDQGARTFTVTHQYLDDDPSGTPLDVYTIKAIVTDNDGGVGTGTTAVTVYNVAPQITSLSLDQYVIDENGLVTLTGLFTDPGTLDTFTLVVNWGDPLSPNNIETYTFEAGTRSFELTHQYLDDNPSGTASDIYTILVTLQDDDLGEDLAEVRVTVHNVPPVITKLTTSAKEIGDAGEGRKVTLCGSFTEVGTLDTHTVWIDWGDGTAGYGAVVQSNGKGTISGSHVYKWGGVYEIKVTLTDDDTGTAFAETRAYITGAGVHNGVLQIVGTHCNDRVTVNQVGKKLLMVHANFLKDRGKFRTFDLKGIQRIEIYLGDGNDHATIAGNICIPVMMDGGAGNDHLKAGRGPAVLIGGSGNDKLIGSPSNDVIYGGDGNDIIQGNGGNDVLYGDAGCDVIYGGKGNDRIYGGDGNDIIHGGGGKDVIYGDAGCDVIYGSKGNDRIYGGDGNDIIHGGGGNDVLYGDAGCDVIYGSSGNDEVHGGDDNDRIFGGGGNDKLYGGAGNDWIFGGSGNDKIYGGPGNDKLFGGSGNDEIYGGEGDDLLVGGGGRDTLDGGPGNNIIIAGAWIVPSCPGWPCVGKWFGGSADKWIDDFLRSLMKKCDQKANQSCKTDVPSKHANPGKGLALGGKR